eukprot:gene1488-12105_t
MFQVDLSVVPCSNQKENQFLYRLYSSLQQSAQYYDEGMKKVALQVIPVSSITKKAKESYESQQDSTSYRDEIVKQLLSWFKGEFFSWVNAPNCDHCQSPTKCIGMSQPTEEEKQGLAGQVEVFECSSCKKLTRFPRYNNAAKLLQTKRGRCGEWAQAFTLCCTAMGFDARYVLDWTDHVWTEVYSDYLGKWVHCDSCENKFDAALMYEAGWGKKLSYVIGFSPDGVIDVTKRYTQKFDEVMERRIEVSEDWLKKSLQIINYQLSIFMIPDKLRIVEKRNKQEEDDFLKNQIINTDELEGRISGSKEWKESRGETGENVQKLIDISSLKLNHQEMFRFNTFSSTKNLNFVGDSSVEKNVIQLTKNLNGQTGAIWFSKKQSFKNSFEIVFQFRISNSGADGFALVLQNDNEKIIGKGGGHLGYEGIKNSIAVEFDTYENKDINNDPNGNHVSIQTNFNDPNSSNHKYSLGCLQNKIPKLNNGSIHTCKVEYKNESLNVFLNDLETTLISVKINLNDLFDSFWIGFTAATGGISQSHDLLSFIFSSDQQNSNYQDDEKFVIYSTAKVELIIKKLKSLLKLNNISMNRDQQNLINNFDIEKMNVVEFTKLINMYPVLDIYRLLLANSQYLKYAVSEQTLLLKILGFLNDFSNLSDANQMMLLRCLCNLIADSEKIGVKFLIENEKIYNIILTVCNDSLLKSNEKIKMTICSFICNLGLQSTLILNESDEEVQLICTMVEQFNSFNEKSIIEKLIISLFRFSKTSETYFDLILTLNLNTKKIDNQNLKKYFLKE